jgi:hypothetical protein
MQSRCPLVEKRSILSMETTIFKVGIATVVKVPELELNDFTLSQLLPALDPKVVEKHPDWIDCRTYDIKTARVHLSVHTWVIRHLGKVILIDTGVGNDKDRPGLKVLDHLIVLPPDQFPIDWPRFIQKIPNQRTTKPMRYFRLRVCD